MTQHVSQHDTFVLRPVQPQPLGRVKPGVIAVRELVCFPVRCPTRAVRPSPSRACTRNLKISVSAFGSFCCRCLAIADTQAYNGPRNGRKWLNAVNPKLNRPSTARMSSTQHALHHRQLSSQPFDHPLRSCCGKTQGSFLQSEFKAYPSKLGSASELFPRTWQTQQDIVEYDYHNRWNTSWSMASLPIR